MVQTVDTPEKIAQVASISANDKEIGGLIAEAMKAVGKDGVITVEESKSMKTDVETKDGMLFDKGYISPYMVTDSERMEATLTDPYILVTERKISAIADILPLLEKIVQVQKPLLIIAEDVEGEASRRSWSTSCAERSRPSPSRRRASATAAKRCSRTSRPSPARPS